MTQMRHSSAEFNNGAVLGVEVSTNGPQGGDAGHGGRVEVVLTNLAMMDLGDESGYREKIIVKAGGDMEMALLASGLEWAGQELRRLAQVGRVEPEPPSS
ncbi:hypothetical protein ACFXAY_34275 [Streptomyces microflavus]|uniref:hypothetical protein n=1 Tax=Streptomyces microflavus TaxID=1919 RepID=UPI0036880743